MKKLIGLLFVLFFVATLQNVQAQTTYDWDDYGLKFTVPAGFVETTSTGEKFEGKSDRAKIHLFGLYPLTDESVTQDNLAEAVKVMAKESGMTVEETGDIDFNGFEGMYAEGTVKGVPTFFACMLDPNGDLNFIVSVLHNNTDAAVALVKSIKKAK